MSPYYIYLIVALVILAIVALVTIIRYRKGHVSLKAPGFEFEAEGEIESDQPPAPQAKGPSARTKIGGKVSGSTVITSAGGGGQAETDVGEDVERSDILTEA